MWRFQSLAISSDGTRVAAGSRDGPLACVWTTATGQLAASPVRDHEGKIRAVSLGARRPAPAHGGRRRPGKGLEYRRGPSQGRTSPSARIAASTAAKAGDGGHAVARRFGAGASRREDGRVELWEQSAIAPGWTTQLEGEVRAVAFSPDGKLLAAAGDDRQIVLRAVTDPNRPLVLGTPPNHFEMINALAFWPKGRLLASASDDTTVRFWRMSDRRSSGRWPPGERGAIGWSSRRMGCSTPLPTESGA